MNLRRQLRGMSFMDVIIGTALVLLIFTALTGLLRSSIQVAVFAKTRSIANTVAESQMEYIRSLAYDSVGTVGGIPSGLVPQISTTTQNGIAFPVRTLIEYVDDPADGLDTADTNGISTDYKRIKVSVSYYANNRTQTVDLVSNYAPSGLETTTNGGTLKISVVNAGGSPVPGAAVHIVNSILSPSIDLTTYSDALGVVFLPGAPTSTEYQVGVSKEGYSSAQTYARDVTNQNPAPGYLTVVKNQTTTGTFAIDTIATLALKTFYKIVTASFNDTFASGVAISNYTNTTISSGSVTLLDPGTGYPLSGSVTSTTQAPTYLQSWRTAGATTTEPGGTSVRYHITTSSGLLVPDSDLSGNAAGFTGLIDLSGISTTTYPGLRLSADFTTTSTTTTPILQSWSLSYDRGPIPFPSIPFTLAGSKTIGSTGAGLPIYKTVTTQSTDSVGEITLPLEWDAYAMTLSGYDVVSACMAPPYTLAPGSVTNSELYLGSSTPNMILVTVRDATANVQDATVTVTDGSYTKVITTDSCGSAYFGGISSGTYSVTVSKTGYTTFNASNVFTGHNFFPVTLQ